MEGWDKEQAWNSMRKTGKKQTSLEKDWGGLCPGMGRMLVYKKLILLRANKM